MHRWAVSCRALLSLGAPREQGGGDAATTETTEYSRVHRVRVSFSSASRKDNDLRVLRIYPS